MDLDAKAPPSTTMNSGKQLPLENTDIIHLKRLDLPVPLRIPDIWGQPKHQPAQMSISLFLNPGFSTAATSDVLDENTVHYGQLAKHVQANARIQSGERGFLTCNDAFNAVGGVITSMAQRKDGTYRVSRYRMVIHAPKASPHGDGVDLAWEIANDDEWRAQWRRCTLTLRAMRLMLLIGVNAKERTGRQPVVVSLNLDVIPDLVKSEIRAEYDVLYSVETRLAKVLESTAFETLEALANFVMHWLGDECKIPRISIAGARLNLEKPLAVVDAEAPGVEVFRMFKRST